MQHGDPPAADAGATLDYLATRATYPAVHAGAVLGALIGLMGLLSLAASMRIDAAWLLARAGVVSAVVGLAVFTVESTSEGLGLSVLAKEAAAAIDTPRADLVRATDAIAEGTHGPSLVGMALLIGIPLIVMGLAIVLDADPSWLGWTGLGIGASPCSHRWCCSCRRMPSPVFCCTACWHLSWPRCGWQRVGS